MDDDFDDEDDEQFPYGEAGSEENPEFFMKWWADGATTLEDAAARVRALAEQLEGLAARGWALSQPVEDGHVWTEWHGAGAPPEDDRARFVPA